MDPSVLKGNISCDICESEEIHNDATSKGMTVEWIHNKEFQREVNRANAPLSR
jgi:hypothetical protein